MIDMVNTENSIEMTEEQVLKPQKSLIEKIGDCEKEIEYWKAECERLQGKVSYLETKTCYVDEQGYGSGERAKLVQDLVQKLNRKDNEIAILQLEKDDIDSLKEELAMLKEELERTKISKTSTGLSEAALKQINEELAGENEELKRKLRELERSLPVDVIVNVDKELNNRNCELTAANRSLNGKVRNADWAMLQIENHLQMISSVINYAREGVTG